MAFPPQFIQQLKDSIAVSDVVRGKVKLARRGREFVGLSPFKQERTPSFTVNDDKQFYHCFSTQKHGSIFDFLMETEGLSFPEAVRQLAQQAGIEVPQDDKGAQQRQDEYEELHAIVQRAAVWFQMQLQGSAGERARRFLQERQVSEAAQKEFGIGYAPPERGALLAHLRDEGVRDEKMERAGLLVRYEDTNKLQGRFFDRVMFPIHDAQARPIGFGARALRADAKAKYLNSPDSTLFHKRRGLYNFHRARPLAFQSKTLLLVEGYMDVISLADAGIGHVAAPLGTAISEEQLTLAWRLAAEPVLCLDGDQAGEQAGFRALERALPMLQPGKSLRFARLPQGQDPDDLVRSEGKAGLAALLSEARPLVEVLWAMILENTPHETPEQQAQLRVEVRRLVGTIKDRDVRQAYEKAMAQNLLDFAPLARYTSASPTREIGRTAKQYSPSSSTRRMGALQDSGWVPREAVILAACLCHPHLLLAYRGELEHCHLRNQEMTTMRNELLAYADTQMPPDASAASAEALHTHLRAAGFAKTLERLARLPGRNRLDCLNPKSSKEAAGKNFLETLRLHHHIYELEMDLETAKAELARELTDENAERVRALKDKIEETTRRDVWESVAPQ